MKMGLTYNGGRLLDSPTMVGEIKGHPVNFYPQLVENAQGQRSTQSVVEVFLNRIPALTCVVASQGFADFMATIALPLTFEVQDPDWPKKMIGQCPEDEAPELWFADNRQRIEAIQQLSKLPFNVAFVSDGSQAFIAVRTANPIDDPRKINQLVTKLITLVEMLESEAVAVASSPVQQDPQSTMANPNDDKNTVEPEISAPKE